MNYEIRDCGPGDYAAVVAIYNHYVSESHATFDVAPFSVGERVPWFSQFDASGPWRLLVAANDEGILGYCCSTPFRTRPAYEKSVETTVYVAADALAEGVGRALYDVLLEHLVNTGLHRAYASIALPNDASIRLHENCGYEQVGLLHEVGFKFGKWCDVALFEKRL